MSIKYIGMDAHQATIVVVVLNQAGKCVIRAETKLGPSCSSCVGLRATCV
jgi:hypothetical protein